MISTSYNAYSKVKSRNGMLQERRACYDISLIKHEVRNNIYKLKDT